MHVDPLPWHSCGTPSFFLQKFMPLRELIWHPWLPIYIFFLWLSGSNIIRANYSNCCGLRRLVICRRSRISFFEPYLSPVPNFLFWALFVAGLFVAGVFSIRRWPLFVTAYLSPQLSLSIGTRIPTPPTMPSLQLCFSLSLPLSLSVRHSSTANVVQRVNL